MLILARIFLITCAIVMPVRGVPCFVASTNLGGGLFSYTFQQGDDPYVWGISSNDNGGVAVPSIGVLEIYDAPGWTHTNSLGWITWTFTNGIAFLDEPVTFSVQSCLTESASYTGTSGGIIFGSVYELPGLTNDLGTGFQWFDYVGPILPVLNIYQSGTNVTVWWSAEAQGMQLEASVRLGRLGVVGIGHQYMDTCKFQHHCGNTCHRRSKILPPCFPMHSLKTIRSWHFNDASVFHDWFA